MINCDQNKIQKQQNIDFCMKYLRNIKRKVCKIWLGADNRNRTCDPLVTNQVLYLLSYTSTTVGIVAKYFLILNIILLSK